MSRSDLNFVIGEMISELNVGHAYLWQQGDVEEPPKMSVGMLGIDFALQNGAYRIARLAEGGPWDVDARNPLQEPGVDVKAGEYLLAVNGTHVDVTKAPWAAFLGLAGETITLTVSEKPELDDSARHVVVKALANDGDLRYRRWVERNRAYVAERTDGRVGYIHVPNTGRDGQNELFRQFFGQTDRAALIIDERWNGGGQIPTRFIELLDRPVRNYWAMRHGRDTASPRGANFGPKCMLINGEAGSGGDLFPYYFREYGLGKLIGMRTWGGLVGISGNPGLMDGGRVTAPAFAFYELDGTWGIEGHGVDPDIKVVDDPSKMVVDPDPMAPDVVHDPQLDAAIDHMLAEIEKHPYKPVPHPPYPDRSGMGVTDTER
jgi:tricorn protease